jgi:hypothetical protein
MKSTIFRDVTPCSMTKRLPMFRCNVLSPSSESNDKPNRQPVRNNKKARALLVACFMLVSCLAYSSTLKMEVTCSSESSVDFQRITWRYIAEHRILHHSHILLIFTGPSIPFSCKLS